MPIKDIALYWPMGPDGAVVTHTLSDTEARLTKDEWDVQARKSVCQGYDDFAELRSTIEKLCSEHKALCVPEVQQKLAAFSGRTRRIAMRLRR